MTIYLNLKGPQGRETVEELTREAGQTYKEFMRYVREMVREYQIAGMNVYRSSRCCANWRD